MNHESEQEQLDFACRNSPSLAAKAFDNRSSPSWLALLWIHVSTSSCDANTELASKGSEDEAIVPLPVFLGRAQRIFFLSSLCLTSLKVRIPKKMQRSWQASVVLFAVLLFAESRTIESNSLGFAQSSPHAFQDLFLQAKYNCNTRQPRTLVVVAAAPAPHQSSDGLPPPVKSILRKKSSDVHPVVRIRELRSPVMFCALHQKLYRPCRSQALWRRLPG
jgi:hypothetical protein